MRELAQQAQAIIGLQLTPSQIAALSIYERELLSWNERFNLTAIQELKAVRLKHFLDSLTCLIAMRNTSMDNVIDVGTGAGFPGLPIKIACPSMSLTLVESVGKKAEFCRHIVQVLGLKGVQVIQERIEVLGQDPTHRENYDWALARAVAILPVLAEYLLPLVRIGGSMLAMKGENAPLEAHASEHALQMLGGHLQKLIPITIPGIADERYLIAIDKVHATPHKYPRRSGMPAKRPLGGHK